MTDRKIVLVTGATLVPPLVIQRIQEHGYDVRHIEDDSLDKQQLHDALRGVSGYLIGGDEKVLDEHFERAEALAAVAWIGTDFKANVPGWRHAFELGIGVINAPGANARSVAEFAFALMLALSRPTAVGWSRGDPECELHGQKLGLIGAGRIGGIVARIAVLGFGMEVSYHAPRRNPSLETELGIAFQPTKEVLLRQSDIISLHRTGPLPLEPAEIGPAELALLKQSALIINTGHRHLIDLPALAAAFAESDIRAAVDDMPSDDDSSDADMQAWRRLAEYGPGRFLSGPQKGYHTQEANDRASMAAAESVCAALRFERADNINNDEPSRLRPDWKPATLGGGGLRQ